MLHALRIAFAGSALALSVNGTFAAEVGAASEPIKLAVNEWTGAQLTTQIAGKILEAAGYEVEYVTAGYQNMWQAMADGQLHAGLEIWGSNVTDQYRQMEAEGKIEDLGVLGLDAREGFAYPPHVAELCPGLPDWEALKQCAPAFATAETLPQGRLVDYPGDWGTPGADRIGALELPFRAVPAGSEGALVAEIRASAERKTPLLVVFWQPHWAVSEYNLQFAALPEGADECYDDPAYGPNPEVTGDCDFLPTRVFKTVWPGFKDKWPAAYEILTNFTLSTDAQQPMLAAVDVEGISVDAVATEWLEANEAEWRPIVDAALD
jgi:glycine betaine/proline transport system substrate-binding protein